MASIAAAPLLACAASASDSGEWIDVPDSALITEPNRVGRTMVWPLRIDGKIFIRCFMPGSMG